MIMARASVNRIATETCEGCKFWLRLDNAVQVPGQPDKGFCRRRSPTAAWTDDGKVTTAPFPVMYSGQWCGEFVKKGG